LLWAVGYYTDEDYFVSRLAVEGLPAPLQRGQSLVESNRTIENVRLERHSKASKKIGNWKWRRNPLDCATESLPENSVRFLRARSAKKSAKKGIDFSEAGKHNPS
jgi:hypothetical protein